MDIIKNIVGFLLLLSGLFLCVMLPHYITKEWDAVTIALSTFLTSFFIFFGGFHK